MKRRGRGGAAVLAAALLVAGCTSGGAGGGGAEPAAVADAAVSAAVVEWLSWSDEAALDPTQGRRVLIAGAVPGAGPGPRPAPCPAARCADAGCRAARRRRRTPARSGAGGSSCSRGRGRAGRAATSHARCSPRAIHGSLAHVARPPQHEQARRVVCSPRRGSPTVQARAQWIAAHARRDQPPPMRPTNGACSSVNMFLKLARSERSWRLHWDRSDRHPRLRAGQPLRPQHRFAAGAQEADG